MLSNNRPRDADSQHETNATAPRSNHDANLFATNKSEVEPERADDLLAASANWHISLDRPCVTNYAQSRSKADIEGRAIAIAANPIL